MAGFPGGKRPFNLALLAGFAESLVSESSTPKSTRSFDGGAVGLRIVAAMTEVAGPGGALPCRRPATAGARSDPIPIVPAGLLPERRVAPDEDGEEEEEKEEEELSESYTCVIRHEGGSIVRRMVYLTGEGFDGADDIFGENQEAFFYCSLPPPRAPVDPRSAAVDVHRGSFMTLSCTGWIAGANSCGVMSKKTRVSTYPIHPSLNIY